MRKINVRLSLANDLYKGGAAPAADLEQGASRSGISRHELHRAAASLGIDANAETWRLPEGIIPFMPRGGKLYGPYNSGEGTAA